MTSNPSVNILVTVRCLGLEGAAIQDIHRNCLSPTIIGIACLYVHIVWYRAEMTLLLHEYYVLRIGVMI